MHPTIVVALSVICSNAISTQLPTFRTKDEANAYSKIEQETQQNVVALLPTRALMLPDDKNANNAASYKCSDAMYAFDGAPSSLLPDCVMKHFDVLAQYTEQKCTGGENKVCEKIRDQLNEGLTVIAGDSQCKHMLQSAFPVGKVQQNMRTCEQFKKLIMGQLLSAPCQKLNDIFKLTLRSLVDLVPRSFSALELCPSLYHTTAKASDGFIYLLLIPPIYQPWHHRDSHGTIFFEDLLLAFGTGFVQALSEKNQAALSTKAMKTVENVRNIVALLKHKVAPKSGSGSSSTN